MISTHADPMWTRDPGSLFIERSNDSIASGKILSTEVKAQAPPNKAISRVVGVWL